MHLPVIPGVEIVQVRRREDGTRCSSSVRDVEVCEVMDQAHFYGIREDEAGAYCQQ